MAKKIYLGLTTITPGGQWKNKVKEIDELGIKEISLFPTCLKYEERKELYKLLEATKLQTIPHVHIREEDMEDEELDYLVRRYKARVFNAHPTAGTADFIKNHQKYKDNLFIENQALIGDSFESIVKSCGGICLDLAHYESHGLRDKNQGYEKFPDLLRRYKIGVNHLSAIKPNKIDVLNTSTNKIVNCYDSHWLDDLSEVDYVKKYEKYLAEIISIELENPLKRQLEVKAYLEKILDL